MVRTSRRREVFKFQEVPRIRAKNHDGAGLAWMGGTMSCRLTGSRTQRAGLFLRNVREQPHEPSPQDRPPDGALVLCAVPGAATRLDVPLPVDHQPQCLQILEIDVNRPGRMIATVRAEATTKLLFQSCAFLAAFLDFNSVERRHLPSIPSPASDTSCRNRNYDRRFTILQPWDPLTLEIHRAPRNNDPARARSAPPFHSSSPGGRS
jgi:hypothetical protein